MLFSLIMKIIFLKNLNIFTQVGVQRSVQPGRLTAGRASRLNVAFSTQAHRTWVHSKALFPLHPSREKHLTTQKITLKKSLFKKVLAARTVTKRKETDKQIKKEVVSYGTCLHSLIEFFIPSKHDSSHSISVSLIGLSLAGSSWTPHTGSPHLAFSL